MLKLLIKLMTSVSLCAVTLGVGPMNGPNVVTVVSKEGSDAILPCSPSTNEDLVQKLFDWKKDDKEVFLYDAGVHYNNGRPGQDQQFKGRVSHFPGQLKFGNASIIIQNTTVDDNGMYTCIFPRLKSQPQKFNIKLVVELFLQDRSGINSDALSKPFITIANITEDGVVLQCVVQFCFPKPSLQWHDNDGNTLPAEELQVSEKGGRYNIILQTTVTKTTTNCFYCEVKQDDIGHIVINTITVPEKLFEDKSCQVVYAWIGGWFIGVLTVVVAAAVVLFVGRKYVTVAWKKGSSQQKNDFCSDY